MPALFSKERQWEEGVMRLFSYAKNGEEVNQMLWCVMSGGDTKNDWKNALHNFLMPFSQNN